ncbi:MAG: hypothetical protein Alpg2KO_29650 [Alphaproteobacteria bacterium]
MDYITGLLLEDAPDIAASPLPVAFDLTDMGLRLAVALVLGTLMGLDRELKRKPVGLRPVALVSLGAAGFMLVTLDMAARLSGAEGLSLIEPSRVVQGVIGGIGFLGAGALIGGRNGHVKGAATGAGIWAAGAVGIACGIGSFALAGAITALVMLAQFTLGIARAEIREDIDDDVEPEISDPAPSGQDRKQDGG